MLEHEPAGGILLAVHDMTTDGVIRYVKTRCHKDFELRRANRFISTNPPDAQVRAASKGIRGVSELSLIKSRATNSPYSRHPIAYGDDANGAGKDGCHSVGPPLLGRECCVFRAPFGDTPDSSALAANCAPTRNLGIRIPE